MAYASAARLDTSCVPLIDVGALRDGSNPQAVADALHRASHDIGFVYVTNHASPRQLFEHPQSERTQKFLSQILEH